MRYEPEWEKAHGRAKLEAQINQMYGGIYLDHCTFSSAPTPERDALVDIAYDCPTLEIAQERARQALK